MTRVVASVACLAMVAWGVVNLYGILPFDSNVYKVVAGPWDIFGWKPEITFMTLGCLGLFLLIGSVVAWYLNRPRPADFMIETEGELRKVSWPARSEYLNTSIAVLVVIVSVTLYILLVDTALQYFMTKFKIGF